MYYVLVLSGNRCKDEFLPDNGSWSGSISVTGNDAHRINDIEIPVRLLDNEWFVSCPKGFKWEGTNYAGKDELHISGSMGLSMVRNTTRIRMQFIRCTLADTVFKKYLLPQEGRVDIGRDKQGAIVMEDNAVSAHHGVLKLSGGECWYEDEDSQAGSYINGIFHKNDKSHLSFGDVITFPSGFKILYLGSIIAVNNTKRLSQIKLTPAVMHISQREEIDAKNLPEMIQYHHRMVRILDKVDNETVELEAPPAMQSQNEQPMILSLGPSLTMIVPMGLSILVSGRSASGLVMIGGSSAMSIMWGIIGARYRRKTAAQLEEKRRRVYGKYISEMDALLHEKYDKEYSRLLMNNPDVGQCALIPGSNSRRLWERLPSHPDFTTVRLGKGKVPITNEIKVPKEKLSLIDDPLSQDMKDLSGRYSEIVDAPITITLKDNPVVGIIGGENAYAVAKSIVIQLAALHSYHDLHICILTEEKDADQWQWARWLPHVFASEDRTLRMVVSTSEARQAVLSHLDDVLAMRVTSHEEKKDNDDQDGQSETFLPHYVVLCTNPDLLDNAPLMRTVVSGQYGVSVVLLCSGLEHLPKECKLLIDVDGGNVLTADGEYTKMEPEYPHEGLLKQFSSDIAPIRVKASAEDAAIPTLVTFLEIYGVKRVEDMDIWRMWSENKAYEGLKSIIGYRAGSQPFILDISDKAHGPHGLVAGTTGSGKSVMLETYILSLAANYSPDMVRFILIDYKGGGMADTFKDLPHVTGIIDNLQGPRIIQRALASIEGEIHRRERIFKESGVNNIHDYMRFVAGDPNEEKLPHLIIIIDEFAELKSEQPEFMAKLVSAARVGRSLGLHLILATQKPSGSVSPEIEANTNFRICLRVQSRSDSMDMLHHPDAAYIKGMGRCYVKVGNDEIFEQVQTSFSGAEYKPNERDTRFEAKLLDGAGRTINIKKKRKKTNERIPTEMDSVLEEISRTAKMHNLDTRHLLWQPILKGMLYLDELDEYKNVAFNGTEWKETGEGLIIPFALADDVANQRYLTAQIDITAARNLMLVGLAGTGKTTLVQTMVTALASKYSPEKVNIYIMSLTSRTLGSLLEFPQVGDVIFDGDEHEIFRMIDMLKRECDTRKNRFEAAFTNGFVEYNRACRLKGEKEEAAIVVFIDRMQQLRDVIESNEEVYDDLFRLIREGSSSGIFFVITSMGGNEIPMKLRDCISGIALQLREKADFSDTLGVRVPVEMDMIAPVTGRGMAVINETPYEIQVALAGHAQTDIERIAQITELGKQMQNAWKGPKPKGISRIPEDATYEQFSGTAGYTECEANRLALPIAYGINSGDARVIDLQTDFSYLITGARKTGKTNALMCIAKTFAQRGAMVYIAGGDEWNQFIAEIGATRLRPESKEYADFICGSLITDYVKPRNAEKKTAQNKSQLKEIASRHVPIVMIFDNMDEFMDIGKYPHFTNAAKMLGFMFTDAANCGIYTFASVSTGALTTMARQTPFVQLIGQNRGIVMGGRFGDNDVWNIPNTVMNYKQKNASLPKGNGFMVNGESVEQIVFPLLVEK